MEKGFSNIRETVGSSPVFFAILLIIVAVTAFYSNSFRADWHYDDFHHIKENINIRKISNIPDFFADATTFSRNPQTRMYRPLLMATHAINYQIGILTTRNGYDVTGYHVVNFLFHLITVLTIFFIIRYLFTFTIPVNGLDPTLPAVFGALLFGLNTINTETIVYVSSRSSGMATMFVLLSFYYYLKATHEGHLRWIPILISSSLYFCGMLSKEIAITLPALILYYEFFLNNPVSGTGNFGAFLNRVTVRLLPHALTAFLFLLIREMVIKDNLIKVMTDKGGTPAAPNLTAQLATQSRAWILYIREWFLPTGLSIDKPFAVSRTFASGKVLASVLVILLIVALAVYLRKRHPAVTFGIFWWFTALLPTTVFRLNVPINDHRLYLPGFGFTLVFVYVAGKLYTRFKADGGLFFKVFVTVCISILLLMGIGTLKRNMAFATEETMWKDVILKDKRSVRGYNNLGIYYEQHGEWDKALAHYQQTIRLAPMFPNPYINIGNVYHKKKEYENAEKWMKRAIQLDPKSALANYNLGNILRESGKTDEAIGAYKRALELNPRYIEAANNLANIYFKQRNYQEAITYYKRALFIDPTFAMSYYNIALANENLGQFQMALENYQQFLRFWLGDPKYRTLAQRKIADLSRRTGK
jgi:Tfp pilus assembly protein PilF